MTQKCWYNIKTNQPTHSLKLLFIQLSFVKTSKQIILTIYYVNLYFLGIYNTLKDLKCIHPGFLVVAWYLCRVGVIYLIAWSQGAFLSGNICLARLSSLLGVVPTRSSMFLWQPYMSPNLHMNAHIKLNLCQSRLVSNSVKCLNAMVFFGSFPRGTWKRHFLFGRAKFITWHLRHPKIRNAKSIKHFYDSHMSLDLHMAPTLKWPCVKSGLVGGWINPSIT